MRLEQIYQEVILDHYKHPHHRGLREPYGAEVRHVNPPTCGDEITLRVALSDDGGDRHRHLVRRPGLLDQPGVDVGADRSGDRSDRRRRAQDGCRVLGDGVVTGQDRGRRGGARRRHRVRRRLEIPPARSSVRYWAGQRSRPRWRRPAQKTERWRRPAQKMERWRRPAQKMERWRRPAQKMERWRGPAHRRVLRRTDE